VGLELGLALEKPFKVQAFKVFARSTLELGTLNLERQLF